MRSIRTMRALRSTRSNKSMWSIMLCDLIELLAMYRKGRRSKTTRAARATLKIHSIDTAAQAQSLVSCGRDVCRGARAHSGRAACELSRTNRSNRSIGLIGR